MSRRRRKSLHPLVGLDSIFTNCSSFYMVRCFGEFLPSPSLRFRHFDYGNHPCCKFLVLLSFLGVSSLITVVFSALARLLLDLEDFDDGGNHGCCMFLVLWSPLVFSLLITVVFLCLSTFLLLFSAPSPHFCFRGFWPLITTLIIVNIGISLSLSFSWFLFC